MANQERGEIPITVTRVVDGQKQQKEYTLRLSTNAACKLETKNKKTIGQMLNEAGRLQFESIRDIVFVLLQKYHSDEIKKPEDAGDFIDDAGGVAVMFDALKQLSAANAPETPTEDGAEPGPPVAANGTGDSSTSPRAA